MSKESLDYQKLCSNYYLSWEEGCCMESCEFYNHNECPVVYVNGLLEERDKTIADLEAKLALTEKALELACECFYNNFVKTIEPYCECCTSPITMQEHFKTKAKEMMKSDLE